MFSANLKSSFTSQFMGPRKVNTSPFVYNRFSNHSSSIFNHKYSFVQSHTFTTKSLKEKIHDKLLVAFQPAKVEIIEEEGKILSVKVSTPKFIGKSPTERGRRVADQLRGELLTLDGVKIIAEPPTFATKST